MKATRAIALAAVLVGGATVFATTPARPNVIIVLADDLGWGDVAYNGHPLVQTPALDKLAADGVRLDRFYAQAPSCSPTRASTLTGRNGYRFGVIRANNGRMEPGERTIAEYLSDQGYATGHFGKWHLGTLTRTQVDGKRGGTAKGEGEYAPPWDNGFQVCFSTESKVPTWNPMERPNNDVDSYWEPRAAGADPADWIGYGTSYWTGENNAATGDLTGDDSRIIMDRALPFIEDAVKRKQPFLAVIWFHAPHMPVVAGPEFAALYPDCTGFERSYFGSITALDAQVGRLRGALEALGAWENTLLVFGSDNGPESIAHSEDEPAPGSAGVLRGRKRSLHEGGVRVPGIISWPAKLEGGRASSLPFTTSDLLPSIVSLVGGTDAAAVSPVDGIDALSLLRAGVEKRSGAIPFEFVGQVALLDNHWKLYSADDGASYALFDLSTDPTESHDVAAGHSDRVAAMTGILTAWRESCRASSAGTDYR